MSKSVPLDVLPLATLKVRAFELLLRRSAISVPIVEVLELANVVRTGLLE
jgi:hypothetical protein